MPPGARRAGAVALVTLALAVVLYPGALLRGEAFFERDLHLDWYPHAAALVRCVETGAWPLWAPGMGFGKPLLGDPATQVLYPLTWPVLALPWNLAYTGLVLVHLLIGAWGAERLAARLGAGRWGALAAGPLFVLSGPVQSSVNLWHHFCGTAWMPWVLLAYLRALLRPSRAAALRLAGFSAIQILAGSADVCAMTHLAGLIGAVALVLARLRRRRRVAAALVATATGLALAGIGTCAQWGPAADVVSRSARRALPEDVRTAWSVPPAGLARLVAPLDPARALPSLEVWRALYDRTPPPLLFSIYLGLPTLGLAAASLAARRRRSRAIALAGLSAATLAFAMGPYAAVYGPLTGLLPWLQLFRYPSKALLLVALLVAALAGLGVRALLAAGAGARLAVAGLLLLATAGAAAAAGPFRPAASGIEFLCLGGAASACLALAGRGLRVQVATAAVAVLAVADLSVAHRALNPTLPRALLLETPAVAAIVARDDGRRVQIYDYHTIPGTAPRLLRRANPYPVAPVPGVDRRLLDFALQRQLLVPPTAAFFGVETSFDFDVRRIYPHYLDELTHALRRAEGTPAHTRLLQLGAVARLVALHDRGLEDLRLERTLPALSGDTIRVFQVPDPRPRAWLVSRTRAADGAEALRVLEDPGFDPAREAVVSGAAPLDAPGDGSSRVEWIERRPDRQRLETHSSGPALLVLADAYDPGWRASVDGAAREVVRTNLALRGVVVPPGRHVVELVYRPLPVLAGLAVSALALAGALALVRRRA